MKNISIRIQFDDKIIQSKIAAMSDLEVEDVFKLIEHAMAGNLAHITVDHELGAMYIPKSLLIRSIITIITHDS